MKLGRSLDSQRGFTLVELMVGVSASLAVVAMALIAYSAAQTRIERIEQAMQTQMHIQVALRQLRTYANLAGGSAFEITAAQEVTMNAPRWLAQDTVDAQAESSHDSMSLGYASDFWESDCLGSSQGKNERIVNHFKISAKKELSCKDTAARTSSGYQALADDVQEMRIQLAVRSSQATGLRWISASLLDSTASERIEAFQVCLRIKVPPHWPVRQITQQDCWGQPLKLDAPTQILVKQIMTLPHRLTRHSPS